MIFVCPQPAVWHEIHLILQKARKDSGGKGTPPPVALILNGWVFSNDVDKHQRWLETLAWAKARGLENLIPDLKENEKYCVDKMSTSTGHTWSDDEESDHDS